MRKSACNSVREDALAEGNGDLRSAPSTGRPRAALVGPRGRVSRKAMETHHSCRRCRRLGCGVREDDLIVSGSLKAESTKKVVEIVYDLLIETIELGSFVLLEFGVRA
jgi:hypothetical protein